MSNRRALVAALIVLTACGGGSSTEPERVAATLSLSSTNVTFASLNAAQTLVATAFDADGGVIPNAPITWTTNASLVASVSPSGVVTAVGNGIAEITASSGSGQDVATVTVQQVAATLTLTPDTLRLGAAADTATITATVRDAGGTAMTGVTVDWTTDDAAVATVNASGRVTAQGDGGTYVTGQVAPGGSALTESARVEVGAQMPAAYLVGGVVNTAYSDAVGPASPGSGFTYAITGGALPTGLSIDGSTGAITGTPTASGAFFFQVTAANASVTVSQGYAITISTKPASAFNLWVAYNGGTLPPANAQTALNQVLARWETIITGDAGAQVTYPPTGLTPATCSLVDASLMNGAVIEDVAILMAVGPIDGLSNTLARGGPCGYGRAQLPAVISGQMLIDEADAAVASQSFLADILTHEIAHALGFGTIWFDSVRYAGTDSVEYDGVNAKTEWITLGGTGGVPLQPDLGAHWDEAWFNAELMTPSAEGVASAHPLSRMSIGALLDLGWTAALTAADAFTLPMCAGSCTVPGRAAPANDRVFENDAVIERLLPLPPGAVGAR